MKTKLTILLVLFISLNAFSQGFDSTQIGKKYPYVFPILGKKAYAKGYSLPKPHGVMINFINTKQNIILEDFEMGFSSPKDPNFSPDEYVDLSEIIVFGPSSVTVNTLSFRADTWLLPFFNIGGFYGQYQGSTNVTLTDPFPITSIADNNGAYWGANALLILPLGPVNMAMDYSSAFSQNDLLNKPVKVNIAGARVIKNFPIKNKKEMFIGVWAGAQFQFLNAKTEGQIDLNDAIDQDGTFQQDLDDWYDGLTEGEKKVYGDKVYEGFTNFANSTVHYRFDKRLERNWNFIFGGQWQINREFQFRSELGFLKGKSQMMFSLNYRFGV